VSKLRSIGLFAGLVVSLFVAGCRTETPAPRLSIKDDPIPPSSQSVAPKPAAAKTPKIAAFTKPKEAKADTQAGKTAAVAPTDPDWVSLGERRPGVVGFAYHSFKAPDGKFQRVRVSVKDRAITLRQVRIVFEDGKDQIVDVTKQIADGQVKAGTAYEATIDGGPRALKTIELTYRSRITDSGSKVWATVNVSVKK